MYLTTFCFRAHTWAVLKAAYFISSEMLWKSRDYLGLKPLVEVMDENISATDFILDVRLWNYIIYCSSSVLSNTNT